MIPKSEVDMTKAMICLLTLSLLTVFLTTCCTVRAAEVDRNAAYLKAKPEDLAKWRGWKFGLLISWGPVSVTGKELSWSRESRERFGKGEIPDETYDRLYTKFNPVKYDAQRWVDIAKAAGVRYLVYVTKHHDGFCNFDTRLTDYKITSPKSPYGKDIVKQLADACHRGGMRFGVYYSQPDWRHPDCFTENHQRYLDYYHGQVRELLSNYGRVDILWFDCLGYGGYFGRDARDWGAYRVLEMARCLQPHVVVNNRCGVPADFNTPEQTLGRYNFQRAWESVITFAGKQWSWQPGAKIMSRKECIQGLVSCACGDGNLLLGVGPMPDGRIDPRQAQRLAEVGRWLKKYGQSVYETRGGPVPSSTWGGTTYRGDIVYVHVLKWPEGPVTLSPIEGKIVASSVMTGGSAQVVQTDRQVKLSVAESDRRELDTIVALKFDRPVPKPRMPKTAGAPWPRQRAFEWYEKAWPIVGCNYLPRTAVNMTEMWQKETFDPKTIDEELGWAQQAGYNSVRVFIQYLVWKHDPQGLKRRIGEFLAIAHKHKIRPMLVLFCDCAFAGKEPYLGKQDEPVPGVHNSGWVPSPGLKRVTDRGAWPDLERYVKDIVGTFGQDDRVLIWDLYNEPGASRMWEKSLPLAEATFAWARAAKPKQPLTMGAWIKFDSRMSKRLMELSDVISFHGYDGPKGLEAKINTCKTHLRPMICTECLARHVGSRFDAILPVFARNRVGWYNWGLVAGRTQTYMHWGSKRGTPEPKIWQHDVFRPDGTPYDAEEIKLIRRFPEYR